MIVVGERAVVPPFVPLLDAVPGPDLSMDKKFSLCLFLLLPHGLSSSSLFGGSLTDVCLRDRATLQNPPCVTYKKV